MLYVIRIGLEKKCDEIHQDPNSEYADRKYIEDAHSGFSLVELMRAQEAEEEAQTQCDPFIFGTYALHLIDICVCVLVQITVIDNDLRLLCCRRTFKIFNLTAAMRTNDALFCDLLTAFLTEFCLLLIHRLSSFVVFLLFLHFMP